MVLLFWVFCWWHFKSFTLPLCLSTAAPNVLNTGSRMYSPVGFDWSTDEDQRSFHSVQPGACSQTTRCVSGEFSDTFSATPGFPHLFRSSLFPLAALSPAFRELLLSVHQGHGVILLSPLQSSAFGGSLPCTVCSHRGSFSDFLPWFPDSAHEPSKHTSSLGMGLRKGAARGIWPVSGTSLKV